MNTITHMHGDPIGGDRTVFCSRCEVRPAIKTDSNSLPICAKCARGPSKPYTIPGIRIGRNEKCPCGSGKKFKNCHQPIAQKNGGYLLRNPETTETESP